MDIDKLTLEAGVDIPFPALRVNIHQPTIREIAIIGEKKFYEYLSFFRVSAKVMMEQIAKSIDPTLQISNAELENLVKSALGNKSDFEVFMQIAKEDAETRAGVEAILLMLMPQYFFEFDDTAIIGMARDVNALTKTVIIREDTFKQLKEIIDIIFCLNVAESSEFNPIDDKAKAIAEKLKKGREKARISKGETPKEHYVLANYISCLGIGPNALNILTAINLTVYQLFDQMQRFGLKIQNEHSVSAALAGAKDVEIVDWLVSI